jgi:hypothetical protein
MGQMIGQTDRLTDVEKVIDIFHFCLAKGPEVFVLMAFFWGGGKICFWMMGTNSVL